MQQNIMALMVCRYKVRLLLQDDTSSLMVTLFVQYLNANQPIRTSR
ncbi:hypothetical protein [Vibrio splendidus]|nr:hypothetical protein [Vibrio splendidus]